MSFNETFMSSTMMYNNTSINTVGDDDLCQEIYYGSKQKYIADNFVVVSACFAIIFNCLVLLVSFKYVKFKKRNEQWFVVNIALSDFILGLIYLTTMKNAERLPWYLCRPYYAAIWTTSVGSMMFLLLLNLHKLATLLFPIQSLVCLTRNKILLQVFICWSTILTISVFFSMKPFLRVYERGCYQCFVEIEYDYYSLRLLLLFILPLTISLIISVCIFVVAQKNSRQSKKWFRRILFVFSSTIWTAITSLPYRCAYLATMICVSILLKSSKKLSQNEENYLYTASLRDHTITYSNYNETSVDIEDQDIDKSSCFHQPAQYILLCWLSLGSVINPLITIFTQSHYRNGVRKLWRGIIKGDGYTSPDKSRDTSLTGCSGLFLQ